VQKVVREVLYRALDLVFIGSVALAVAALSGMVTLSMMPGLVGSILSVTAFVFVGVSTGGVMLHLMGHA